MDTLHSTIAMLPIAMYLIVMGSINVSRRPWVINGARDTGALGIALSGFAIVGPMELFLPESAAAQFGAYVWLLLLAFYFLSLMLVILLANHCIIIYNVGPEQCTDLILTAARTLDASATWQGSTVLLPNASVQFHVDTSAAWRNVRLVAIGHQPRPESWYLFERTLREVASKTKSAPSAFGATLISIGICLLFLASYWITGDSIGIVQNLRDMLRR